MSSHPDGAGTAESVYRVDAFDVPDSARDAFIGRVRTIQQMLDPLDGCRQNLVLTQTDGAGRFNVVTVVEWESSAAMESARRIVRERYAAEGFDPAAFMSELGVQAELGVFALLP